MTCLLTLALQLFKYLKLEDKEWGKNKYLILATLFPHTRFGFAFAVCAFLNMKCPGLLLTCVMVLRETEFTLYRVGVIRK